MTIKTAAQIREFWFSDDIRPNWFVKSDDTDRRITKKCGPTYAAAHAGNLADWMQSPADALALLIVLDQFPRNMFRGSGRSYESNDLALKYAREALDRGYDQQLDATRRAFFYLPFMHSEDLADQDCFL